MMKMKRDRVARTKFFLARGLSQCLCFRCQAGRQSPSLSRPTCVLEEDLVHICAGVLEQLVVGVEDDDGDLAVAKHGELVRLLHQTELPLCEGHLTIR